MLTQPAAVTCAEISASLRTDYGLRTAALEFLPLGADRNTAVYRATMDDGTALFVKLRFGAFNDVSADLPGYLREQGLTSVIAPMQNSARLAWTRLHACALIVYPFVTGHDGYAAALTAQQWADLGATIRRMHALQLPVSLAQRIPREDYTPRWRDDVRAWYQRATNSDGDALTRALAALMQREHAVIDALVYRADDLARVVQAKPMPAVLCHADLHAANMLIDDTGQLFVVDWDTALFAPKERDLMFIGAGQFSTFQSAEAERMLFGAGYGPISANSEILAYYRYERIVQDIAAFCASIGDESASAADREQELRWLASNFGPDGVIAAADAATDETTGSASAPGV
jgi:spectinomycin phosphotransferase